MLGVLWNMHRRGFDGELNHSDEGLEDFQEEES